MAALCTVEPATLHRCKPLKGVEFLSSMQNQIKLDISTAAVIPQYRVGF